MDERDVIEAEFRKELRIAELCLEDVRRRATGEISPHLLAMQVRSLSGATHRLTEIANELKGYATGARPEPEVKP